MWQNYTNKAEYVKSLPQGYATVEKSSRNPNRPNQPGVSMVGELYWPAKIRNQSNGNFKWVNIHEKDPTVKGVIDNAIASKDILT